MAVYAYTTRTGVTGKILMTPPFGLNKPSAVASVTCLTVISDDAVVSGLWTSGPAKGSPFVLEVAKGTGPTDILARFAGEPDITPTGVPGCFTPNLPPADGVVGNVELSS